MQTSHPRILLRWPLLATPVALSRPSRTCVVRTSTDEIWKMQQSEGHVLSSAARGPPLVFRRREHAESATKSAPWCFLLTNKTEDSKFVAVLCHCFVTMVVWGGGLHLIDQFHYIKMFLLGSWLGEIKQKKYIIHNLLSLKMISFVLFPYALVLSLYFDILKLFLVMYRAANKFCSWKELCQMKNVVGLSQGCTMILLWEFCKVDTELVKTTDYIQIFTVKCYFIGMTFHMHPSRFVSLIFIMSNLY